MHWFAFCPNPHCAYHRETPSWPWAYAIGWYATKAFGKVHRFRCPRCGRRFSTQTFSTHYYLKRPIPYRDLLFRLVNGGSLRGMSRALRCSLSLLTNRIDRLARQGLALHAQMLHTSRIPEDICIDGFVSFDRSQYFPSEIPIAACRSSAFVLDLSHCSRKRSGTMRPAQKAKAKTLYASIHFERGAIARSFTEVLSSCIALQPTSDSHPLVLITDEKPDYARVVHHLPAFWTNGARRLVHLTVSSRLPRTTHNPLFASNYLDRELRKDLANHHRETPCFSRNVANAMMRLWAYLAWHNYLKPFRIRWPTSQQPRTHAEASGIHPSLLHNVEQRFFSARAFLSLSPLTPPMRKTWLKRWLTPGTHKPASIPSLALD